MQKEVKEVLGKSPPKPEFITSYYWSAGVHMWKPGEDILDNYNKILQPDNKKNIFICVEAYSKKQCWIEGALETSTEVFNKITNRTQRGGTRKQKQLKKKSSK